MRRNRFPVIDGDGHITERSQEILEYPGGNYRGASRYFRRCEAENSGR
ncbi:MAG TPA: hypothetical protein VJQ55_01885 [Candidatus Binatia bacterium]|nr:hypothetical protein [Candidatus Binatia bacterium]